MLDKSNTFHMLGIGGIGVSGIARILKQRGYDVQGSDIRESSITEALADEGFDVVIGHDESNIDGADVVVVSTAIPEDNVELQEAKSRGLPVVHRAEILEKLVEDYHTIGVTGTHGKGTVSSMITWILEVAGYEPGFAIGGMLKNFETNARDAGGDWMVLEIDESDGSHLNIKPDYALCNFVEADHLNYYDGFDDVIEDMKAFVESNEHLKEFFANLDCAGNRQLVAELTRRATGYATEHQAEYRADPTGDRPYPLEFSVHRRRDSFGDFELEIPGRYNIVNAMGAFAVAHRLGIDADTIREALESYEGMENRFTVERGGGVTVVKDYNSHPTSIEKALQSATDLADGRVIGVFKPYRYTMIDYLKDEYGEAFQDCDEVIITKMYAADEDPIPGVDTHTIVEKIRDYGTECTYIEDQNDINNYLFDEVEPSDTVVFFGGDDFFEMADEFTAELARDSEATEPEPSQPKVAGPLTEE
jgi:UDP-N-acetylmuramate--alanine ligase